MNVTHEELNDLDELVQSPGWKILFQQLETRMSVSMNEMIRLKDFNEIQLRQARILEDQFLLNLPKRVREEKEKLREGTDDETT